MGQMIPAPDSAIKQYDDCVTVRVCKACGLDFTTTDNYQARDRNAHRCDDATVKAFATLLRLRRFAAHVEPRPQASLAQWSRVRTWARPVDADAFIYEVAELEPGTPLSMFFMRFVIEYFQAVNLARFNSRKSA